MYKQAVIIELSLMDSLTTANALRAAKNRCYFRHIFQDGILQLKTYSLGRFLIMFNNNILSTEIDFKRDSKV
jgi:hypothetical protein